jgi:hypothetical protein
MGRKLRRSLGNFFERAIEWCSVGRIDGLQQLMGEIKRDRSQLAVDFSSGRGEL